MYTKYFKFKALPFQLSPDPEFLFESSVHTRAIAHLKFGLNQSEGFIVITGDVGAGKTTIIQHLLSTLSRRKYTATTVVSTNLDEDNMMRMIASGFDLAQEGRDKTSLFRDIEGFLHDNTRRRKRCLLFVDEAQNLSVGALEELRMLSNIQIDGQPALQLFLLGQPQFRRTLALPELLQLRQRVIASYHLGPLDEKETRDYILHRLHQVGWDNSNPRITEDAFPNIFEYTEGVPRRINNLCSRLLLYCYLEETSIINAETVEAVAQDLESEFQQVLDWDDASPAAIEETKRTLDDLPPERWQEVIDLIESTPVETLAALQPVNGDGTQSIDPEAIDALAKERSYNQLFKRLLLLILDEYLKGRPQPHRQ